jgi:hypothetical protein
LPELATDVERLSLVIEIGGMPVRVHTTDPAFLAMLQDRYAGFVTSAERAGGYRDSDERVQTTSTLNSRPSPGRRSRCSRARDPPPGPLDSGARRFSRRVGTRLAHRHGFARPPIPIPSTPCCASSTPSCWPAREASCCTPPAPSATAKHSCSPAFPKRARPRSPGWLLPTRLS